MEIALNVLANRYVTSVGEAEVSLEMQRTCQLGTLGIELQESIMQSLISTYST